MGADWSAEKEPADIRKRWGVAAAISSTRLRMAPTKEVQGRMGRGPIVFAAVRQAAWDRPRGSSSCRPLSCDGISADVVVAAHRVLFLTVAGLAAAIIGPLNWNWAAFGLVHRGVADNFLTGFSSGLVLAKVGKFCEIGADVARTSVCSAKSPDS
jgi:hypothetical protein